MRTQVKHMRGISNKYKPATSQRNAFTLVEMLVSVTLVLMMMGLFASIFQIATGSMTKQRGISQQDQRARILATNVRKDLQHRTFRYMYPFCPEENHLTSPTSFANRTGYFYISTNDPYTGLDDVIQFTVNANITTEDPDSTPFFGRAAELVDRSNSGASPTSLHINPNQPETDDGAFAANSGASSPYAEISYFIRNGNLYRRVILIREPLNVAGQNLVAQPSSGSGYNYLSGQPDRTDATTYDGLFKVTRTSGSFIADGIDGTLSNDFQLLFDHASFASFSGGNQSAAVLGVEALSNETTGAALEVLANPARRWGFNPLSSRSREHSRIATATLPSVFIGRYTHAETSSLNFNFPQNSCRVKTTPPNFTAADSNTLLGNGNPLDVVNTPLTLNANGVISEFDSALTTTTAGRGGVRRVEDLLLANVHEMKVELWDQRLQRFTVPGHYYKNLGTSTQQLGDYHAARCINLLNGPIPGVNAGAVFDTWHATAAAYDSDGGGGPPNLSESHSPYLPYLYYPPRQNDPSPGPSPSTMPDPLVEQVFPSSPSTNRGYWRPNVVYNINDVVLVPWVDRLETMPPGPPDGKFEYSELVDDDVRFAYGLRMVARGPDVNTSGSSESAPTMTARPNFPAASGRRITDNEVIWESFDNRRPLQSIRLTFRFHDKTSDNMRQLSLVIPMTDVKK